MPISRVRCPERPYPGSLLPLDFRSIPLSVPKLDLYFMLSTLVKVFVQCNLHLIAYNLDPPREIKIKPFKWDREGVFSIGLDVGYIGIYDSSTMWWPLESARGSRLHG